MISYSSGLYVKEAPGGEVDVKVSPSQDFVAPAKKMNIRPPSHIQIIPSPSWRDDLSRVIRDLTWTIAEDAL